jgi:hypothetical protein
LLQLLTAGYGTSRQMLRRKRRIEIAGLLEPLDFGQRDGERDNLHVAAPPSAKLVCVVSTPGNAVHLGRRL